MNTVSSTSEADRGAAFTKEIQNMMHAFGDSPMPLSASVKLVETVLCNQLHCLCIRAMEVTTLREAKEIGVEDVLFLMRRDRVKLHRMLNYLDIKDLHSSLIGQISISLADMCTDGTEEKKSKKRKKMCIDFLESIDQTGELTDKDQPFDAVKHERNVRAELMAQSMDDNRYLEYTNARRTSFTYRTGNVNKIQNWLQSSGIFPELPKSNPLLYEIFAYLAYETVAQIVDLSLLVRQDGAAKPGDAFSYYVAGFTRMPGSYPTQYTAELGSKKIGLVPPITPVEIREALRRYWSLHLTPWSLFSRGLSSNLNTKLLVC